MQLAEAVARLERRVRDRCRERVNRVRYGPRAPRVDERLWVDPADVRTTVEWFPARSAQVLSSWPPARLLPLEEHLHVRFALRHWVDGVPWHQTGAYEYMQAQIARRGRQDDCTTMADVESRFAALDVLHAEVRRERRLRTRQELHPGTRGEDGGILMHVGPAGELVVGDSGKHRLVIAQLVDLPVIPVRVGVVHRDALAALERLRHPPQ